MSVPFLRIDQENGSLIDEAYSIDGEKKEEDLKGSSSTVTTGGDLFLLRDGDEAIASTKRALVSFQEGPKDPMHKEYEKHVSMMIERETKQGSTSDCEIL